MPDTESPSPPEIDGAPTGTTHVAAVVHPPGRSKRSLKDKQPDDATYRNPLKAGGRFTSKGSNAAGTLGCLLWDKKNHEVGFALTAQHVVQPPDIRTVERNKTKLGQPKGTDGSSGYGNDIIGVWVEGQKVMNAAGTFADRDEAIVKLAPGMKWAPEIVGLGPISGMHALTMDETKGGTYPVHKRGALSDVTGGVIMTYVTNAATEPDPDKQHSLLIIRSNPDSNGLPGVFATEGDSGSAIVNDANEVVALLHHVAEDTGLVHCTPIEQILGRFAKKGFDLEVAHPVPGHPPIFTVPGGAKIALPPEVVAQFAADPGMRKGFRGEGDQAPAGRSWFTDVPPPAGTFDRVRDDLSRSAGGRLLVAFMERHGAELMRLPRQDQRFRLAFHRGGGSMLTQLWLRMLLHPEQTLPATLSGVPLMTCVDRILAELRRCASPEALADLAEVRAAIPDLAGLSYQGILDALADGSDRAEGAGH
jgi:hypothetical protein